MTAGKILLTTSRNPTPLIRTFCNEFARMIPGIVRVNRGKMSADEVAEKALEYEADRIVIVDRRHGGPGDIKLFKIGEAGLVSTPPIIHVAGIRLQRDFGSSRATSTAYIVVASDDQGESLKVADALSSFFNIPIMPMQRASEQPATYIHVSKDKASRLMITFMSEPDHEVGPRIVVSGLEWLVR